MIFNTRSPIPIATTSVIGGVKIGTGLSIDSAGVLSSNNSVTIDSILNTASDNPVKNSAITVALNNKANRSEIPTNISELTNDTGYLTSYTETDPTVPSWAKASTKPTYTADEVGALPFDSSQKIATLEGDASTLRFASINTANRYVQAYANTNNESITLQSRYGSAYPITSVKLKGIASPQDSTDAANKDYVDSAVSGLISQETDPVFNASAAAGISATDISNWNAKISDDKTWNSVTLNKTLNSGYTGCVPFLTDTTSTTASLRGMSVTPSSGRIAVYNSSGYLTSNTPSAADNSTKVATTEYVDNAIPKVYSSTNTSGYLTMNTLPIYDGTVV